MKLRIGVMGCAAIARRSVIPAIRANEGFELVAVASREAQKAEELANEFGCKAVTGYDNLLNEAIDAVYIPLPTGLHDEWITKALLAGKHVYAEKSIAASFTSAQAMVKLAESRHLALMEGYMFLYHTQHQAVKELIRDGAIGEIRNVYAAFGFPPLADGNFRYDNQVGGGALYDAAGYPLRAVHMLLGPDYQVTASTLYNDPKTGTNLYGSAFLSGKPGVGAQIVFGFDHFYQCYYEIWGSTGKITAERAFTPGADFEPVIRLDRQGVVNRMPQPACNHFAAAIAEFGRIIKNPQQRREHYDAILLQSESQQKIFELANP